MYIGTAFEQALEAHKGQVDKAGQPYITHLVRVCARLEGDVACATALLHDIIEDTTATADALGEHFPREIVDAVVALTKIDGEAYDDYLMRLAANPLALKVKLADMADNSDPARLALLDPERAKILKEKYTIARAQLTALSKEQTC